MEFLLRAQQGVRARARPLSRLIDVAMLDGLE